MKWALCDCGAEDLRRVPRAWWMRVLFPARRRYCCASCGRVQFVPLEDVFDAKS